MGKKLDAAKEEVAALGWQLCSPNYTNLDTLMSFRCPEGHLIEMTLKQWRKKSVCPVCDHDSVIKVKSKGSGKRIVAIDNATHISGWSIFDNGELESYGKFTTKADETIDRIIEFCDWLVGIIEKWQPDTVLIEDIQQQSNVSIFKTLAKLQGAIEYVLKKNGLEYYIIHSQTWKGHSGVKGKSRPDQKKSAQLLVEKLFGVKATQDECDAILIGKYGVDKFIKNNRMVNFES